MGVWVRGEVGICQMMEETFYQEVVVVASFHRAVVSECPCEGVEALAFRVAVFCLGEGGVCRDQMGNLDSRLP